MSRLLVLKIVLLGEGGVGKTSLRQRYMGLGFAPVYMATIGADFSVKTIKIEDFDLKFNIWDLAGQPRFKEVRALFYRGSSAAIYVFDLTDPSSLSNLKNWHEEVTTHIGNHAKNMPMVVVGNKNDLERLISYEEGEVFAQSMNAPYYETSALSGHNVNAVFQGLGEIIVSLAKDDD